MGRVVRGASCHGASCLWGKLSMGRVVPGASCPSGELSMGRVVMGQVVLGRVSMGRVVREPILRVEFHPNFPVLAGAYVTVNQNGPNRIKFWVHSKVYRLQSIYEPCVKICTRTANVQTTQVVFSVWPIRAATI